MADGASLVAYRISPMAGKEGKMPFRFESLDIWHKAREFSTRIHEITANFPQHELYALASQMNRASDAVCLLIAEGSGLDTNALFGHRLGLAAGETFETVSGSFLARDRHYITAEQQAEIYGAGESLARKINAFRNTLR
ncbi:MAG: four helix bundle protein [Chloroflexi bacterium]|nr:four helix bundle protein [Chloroflexota bacterium]